MRSVMEAAQALAEGHLVAFPTETVYGLGARADQAQAVAQIFAAKGRPSDHPLIVHVADAAAAAHFAAELPPVAQQLMQAFWPGPLTVIVPRRAGLAAEAAGGQDSIGLRCPAHPVAHALLQAAAALGVMGVAAPSANRFGRISPTTAAHVAREFADQPELLILDGGDCNVGIESAIVDCSRGKPVLLRPGALERAAIEAAAGEPLHDRDEAAPRASGTLAAHYAPRAKVRLMSAHALRTALELLGPDEARQAGLAVYLRTVPPPTKMVVRRMPSEANAAARELFATLRALDDEAGIRLIWVEAPPEDSAWDGVRDRLTRAAAA
ncbi:L-threonylcarbamoyladenylate synthase [Leptothrix ochracea]|uniref:L-threonylcarbamoyladenylate synthase n=1 Tax=Leptothrix ochracea TaxID=735331 RepID=UPI0034E26480